MHKLTAGDGYAYLTRHVAAGDAGLDARASLTAYYEQTGNPAGRWYGEGLSGLGDETRRLHPGDVVTEPAMTAVFRDGVDPLTDDALGRPYSRFDDGKRHAVVGYDLTFTAPKSVSVLWALADDATRVIVYDAHRAALASSLEFVEQRVIRTRVGDGGRHQVRTRGMVAAAFDHWDTRAGDPNMHTHVVIANRVQGPDGAWRSVDGRTVHAAVVTVSELYDALLADELARRLPVEWSMRDRGARRNPAFEVHGIDEDLLAHFSTRAEAIHCAEQQWIAEFETTHGRAPTRVETTRARQHLTRATRPPKTVRPLADLLADWANRARVLTGFEPRDLAARALASSYGRALHAHDVGPEVRAAMVAQVLDDVSTRRSVWTTWNLGAAAVRASKLLRMASPAEQRALLNEVTNDAAAACVHLDDNRDPMTRRVGESLFTSTELLGAEKALIDAAETTGAPHRPAEMLGAIPLRTEHHLGALAPDQRAAAEAVITSGRLLDVLVGPAGSGKTTTLAALTSFWRHGIGSVVGLALRRPRPGRWRSRSGCRARPRRSGCMSRPATVPRAVPCATPTPSPARPAATTGSSARPTRSTGGCAPSRTSGASPPASWSSSTRPPSPTPAPSPRSSSRHAPPRRRCCWSATTCNAGPSTPAARSGCSPAADPPPSSPASGASPTPGRRGPASNSAGPTRPRSTPTRHTAPSPPVATTRCSTPPSRPSPPPASKAGSRCYRRSTTGPSASSTPASASTASLPGPRPPRASPSMTG